MTRAIINTTILTVVLKLSCAHSSICVHTRILFATTSDAEEEDVELLLLFFFFFFFFFFSSTFLAARASPLA